MITLNVTAVAVMIKGLEAQIEGVPEKAAEVLREDARRQFAIGGEPAWQPLSALTIAQKRRDGYPRLNRKGKIPTASLQNGVFGPQNILMRTMALYTSWCRADDPDHYELATTELVEIGSTLVYAATHQYGRPGGGYRGSDIPARPVRVTSTALRRVTEIINKVGE